MLTLRPYQQEAVDAVINHVKLSPLACLIVAATGAGKSLIVGALAAHFGTALCLQPSRELVAQNAAKCEALGVKHSIFCAGLGKKDASGPVILGTGASIRKSLSELPPVSVLIVDEAHRNVEEVDLIYAWLKQLNPNVIKVGLTATPFRLGTGYIYSVGPDNFHIEEDLCRQARFGKCVYEISAPFLIEQGYLSPLTIGAPDIEYDTSGLVIERGRFTPDSIAAAMKQETTHKILRELSRVMTKRKSCMIFASTVEHAQQCVDFLGGASRVVDGNTPTKQRDHYIDMLRRGRLRYLVNVATLTTGVDVPRVDVIAVLRPSESASLWQQIVGRGMRLSPETGKVDCLVLDYAGNIERLFNDGDVFDPIIEAKGGHAMQKIDVTCPECTARNTFSAFPNKEGLPISPDGYFMDLDGYRLEDENGPIVAHFGRRCTFVHDNGERCHHRWIAKQCRRCGEDNDIAARKCHGCGEKLVDWNKRLTLAATKMVARMAAEQRQKAFEVTPMRRGWLGAAVKFMKIVEGNGWQRADFYVEGRQKPFSVFIKDAAQRMDLVRNVPYAIGWKKIDGSKYPAVKLYKTPEIFKANI